MYRAYNDLCESLSEQYVYGNDLAVHEDFAITAILLEIFFKKIFGVAFSLLCVVVFFVLGSIIRTAVFG